MKMLKDSFVEKDARQRAIAILDEGTFRELLGPFDGFESPHLQNQGIVPQSDDGVVLGRGEIDGESAIVISLEGKFQGGGIGEVSGAKIAGALELALQDNQKGIATRPVLLFDTGGVRLQEANYGLLSIAEIGAAIVALRNYIPVVGVIPGKIGSFGGMSITAGLFSSLIITREGRIGLNGPEVIEQEAGIEEFDSRNRQLIWNTIGGVQRLATGGVDHLVEDDRETIRNQVREVYQSGLNQQPRSTQVELFQSLLMSIDPSQHLTPIELRDIFEKVKEGHEELVKYVGHESTKERSSRGLKWFEALTDPSEEVHSRVPSVKCADGMLEDERARFIAVVPNPNSRFPRARNGEVGLEEGWTIAESVRNAIKEDEGGDKRAIVAIVDVPSQAYGYNEELVGIHLACSAAADAYATARLAGHPVITLIVGNAISGAFLAHGLQANRILALKDPNVHVHVMSKQSAARITRRTVEELEVATKQTPAMAYDIDSFKKLGALHELIEGINADAPDVEDCIIIKEKLRAAIIDTRGSQTDLGNRLRSREAREEGRITSILVRKQLAEQWS
ncbi:biotin-independent malonate decarboxylase subunit beta [Halalkalibacter krulwichiae]|uniref:Malonyl-S-ACP:biotin-protein carboxyltransferase MADC n=1 Tax=Halalkalibacter krulwichiae TaxID=199441 RepID=A0A1X9MCD7_9BACI|nr:biotin-independent malonate decarboxylase subunit beta [Halalkalibacter krulwichiae]ARK29803.1 Malonyl-S-ACP:biotin-protein carboxyltransferase MADC [Halalkalibacter krulwichiae]